MRKNMARKSKNRTTTYKEEKIGLYCEFCGQELVSDHVFVYCKTPGCEFGCDDLLEAWKSNNDLDRKNPPKKEGN
jgi:hypothetical protein